LAVAIHGLLDAPDLHQIDSGADGHAIKLHHFAFVVLADIPGAWRHGIRGLAGSRKRASNYQRKGLPGSGEAHCFKAGQVPCDS
jgi:hypothetical protein